MHCIDVIFGLKVERQKDCEREVRERRVRRQMHLRCVCIFGLKVQRQKNCEREVQARRVHRCAECTSLPVQSDPCAVERSLLLDVLDVVAFQHVLPMLVVLDAPQEAQT